MLKSITAYICSLLFLCLVAREVCNSRECEQKEIESNMWRSVGKNNKDLIEKLWGYGIIKSQAIFKQQKKHLCFLCLFTNFQSKKMQNSKQRNKQKR